MADIYLSNCDVSLVNATDALWRHGGDTLAAGLAALVAHLREEGTVHHPRIWLGASLCRPVRVAPVAGVRSRKERLQLAELTAVGQSGLTPPCRVAVDVATGTEDAVAVVVEEGVLEAIDRALASVHLRARSVRPWWGEALVAALQSNPCLQALAIWEGRALTLLVGEGRGFSAAQTLYPVESAESASAAFARTLVAAMIAPEDALAVALDWGSAVPLAPGLPADEGPVFAPWVARLGAAS